MSRSIWLPSKRINGGIPVQHEVKRIYQLSGPSVKRVQNKLHSASQRCLKVLGLIFSGVVLLSSILPTPVIPRGASLWLLVAERGRRRVAFSCDEW